MRRISIGLVLAISVIYSVIIPANAAIKVGATCKKEKLVIISNNYLYECKKYNKKLVWKKGSKVIIESPGLEVDGPTPTPTLSPTPTSTPTFLATISQSNAVLSAQKYLRSSSFSRIGLIKQLEFDGFTTEQAIFGVNTTGL